MSHFIPPGWVYAEASFVYADPRNSPHFSAPASVQGSESSRVGQAALRSNSSGHPSVLHAGGVGLRKQSDTFGPVSSPVSSCSLPEQDFFIPPDFDRIARKPHWGDLGLALLKGEVEGTTHLTFNERLKIFDLFEGMVKSLPLGSCISENDQSRLLMTAIEQFFAFQEREKVAADCVAAVFSAVIADSFP